MNAAVKRFARNALGRDFIVTDVHGAFDLVLEGMKRECFDPERDRLFCGGDSIDRGAQSLRARRFLKQPYVHSGLGNHEAWWRDAYSEGVPSEQVIRLTGAGMKVDWWFNAPAAERDELVAMFSDLPYAMEVETDRGLVGIVHGDVPRGMSWQEFTRLLEAGDQRTRKTALWGRSRISEGDESGVPGIDRVFVGHTPQFGGVTRLGNVYYLDTGAIFGLSKDDAEEGRLTLAALAASTSDLIEVRSTIPGGGLVDVRTQLPSDGRPFGNYAKGGSAS